MASHSEIRKGISELCAALLWRAHAARVSVDSPFRLSSGNYSPVYVDCRVLISDAPARNVVTGLLHLVWVDQGIRADCVAGGETAGIPFAAWLADRLGLPMVYVRKERKTHGLSAQTEGKVETGTRVVLVEDLITDGKNKLGFIRGLRGAGAIVNDCLVVFDRAQGADAILRSEGVRLESLTSLDVLLNVGLKLGAISKTDVDAVEKYCRDVAAWHKVRGLKFTE